VVPKPLLSVSVPTATEPAPEACTLVPHAVDNAVPLSKAPLAPAGLRVLSHLNASDVVGAIMRLTANV
jgi:hypothetical protein